MTNAMMVIEIIISVLLLLVLISTLKSQQGKTISIQKDNKKEEESLKELNNIKLSMPLSERCRPSKMEDIVGQEKGIKALRAALCGPNPQHVIIYGPPGVGKTAAARLVLEEAKKNPLSPFNDKSKFIEIDATTVRFDDRAIADPLIGSVHDPIYQGAGALGAAGVPQPKPGAVTKAHGGILFIDEIGELHPIEVNKLLKVLEDRKVFLESAYYNSSDNNIPKYIKDIFDKGLPADFRLIGATTRSPSEMIPAIRSRCVEIFFRELSEEDINNVVLKAIDKISLKIDKECCDIISKYCQNARDALNLVQLCSGVVINDGRKSITKEDLLWIIENGEYYKRPEGKISEKSEIGIVNGLAVYGPNLGTIMQIEAVAKKNKKGNGNINITGIVDYEEQNNKNGKVKRTSMVRCSLLNVLTIINNKFDIETKEYDLHINFPGGVPVDGPSAGISLAVAIYSAIKEIPILNTIAMTGEISVTGAVKPIGGTNAKILGAKKAGVKTVLIPFENYEDCLCNIEGINVIPVKNIDDVFSEVFKKNQTSFNFIKAQNESNILSAESYNG